MGLQPQSSCTSLQDETLTLETSNREEEEEEQNGK
jgi:hypothetical protein